MLALPALAAHSGRSLAATPAPSPTAPIAQLGVEIPTLGGGNWWTVTRKRYISPATMQDIRDNLHASYVRTGWIPARLRFERYRWRREDDGMDVICNAGLHVMVILPSPKDDAAGSDELVANVREFFARYTQRNPGCIRFAEIANEADLRENHFADVDAYAAYYAKVAPIAASFQIPAITSGVSGKDLPWTYALAQLLRKAGVPVSGFGFHPYGVAVADLAAATLDVARAAAPPHGLPPNVYVTEIGQSNARDLYQTIVNLAAVTPALTIYEYAAQPGEDARYGLKNNPALYAAVQRAWSALHADPTPYPSSSGGTSNASAPGSGRGVPRTSASGTTPAQHGHVTSAGSSIGGPVRTFADASFSGMRTTFVNANSFAEMGRNAAQRSGARRSTKARSARSRSRSPTTGSGRPITATER